MKTDDLLNLDISEIKGEVIDEIVENFKKGLDNPILKKVIGVETEPTEQGEAITLKTPLTEETKHYRKKAE